MMLTLLLIEMLILASNIQPVKASGAIYIRADGSIDPPTASIQTLDNVTYTLTENILSAADGIFVERSDIVIEGAGYTVEGSRTYPDRGICLSGIANVTIKNISIKHFYYGVWLDSSSNNSISGNTIANNSKGIALYRYSNDNSISGNNITNNAYGIWLDSSSSNNISGNNIASNEDDSIWLDSSSNNSISGNNITNNQDNGIMLNSSSNRNSISGNSITNNHYGIGFYYSSSNSVSGNTITNNSDGIWLVSSSSNSISGNTIANNQNDGVWLDSSSNNSISGNNITNNAYGVHLFSGSSDNTLYHNNFVNTYEVSYSPSLANVWDNGYPSGGNYWSNYVGVDADDGIGDEPHAIDTNNTDRYPLAAPINVLGAGVWGGAAYKVDVVSNSKVSEFEFDPSEGAFLRFNVTGEDGTSGFCRVTIPRSLLWAEDGWNVYVGEESVNYTIIPDNDYTYLYFTYNHTTGTVQIQGTHAIPEFTLTMILPLFTLTTLIATVLLKKKAKTQLP